MSTFEDRTRIIVTFETDRGALAALKDNPLILRPDEEGAYFANAVRRGVAHLVAAESRPAGVVPLSERRREAG